MDTHTIKHFHIFCGLGGGAAGFNKGHARVGEMQARFQCIGGIDNDPASIRDFKRLTGTPGTVLDMFDREQYRHWHGCEPPGDWREATPADIQRAAHGERPNIVFTSAPCKGFSGLLTEKDSATDRYQALNKLTLRGMWLTLEAFKDDLPEFFIFENVKGVATRGRPLLDQIISLLHHYGYAVAETTHDCGEIGGMAQSRKRFLMVARQTEKVPPNLYEPDKKPLASVGSLLDRMPLPGDTSAGPMHRIPSLQWKTWVRLAFVEAGKDWRSLKDLAVEDGYLRDYLIVPEYQNGYLGVRDWEQHAPTISGRGRPTNGAYSVADPRFTGQNGRSTFGVLDTDEYAGTISGESYPSNGRFAVVDDRLPGNLPAFSMYRVVHKTEDNQLDITPIDDPNFDNEKRSAAFGVIHADQNSGTVTGESYPSNGRFCLADPRVDQLMAQSDLNSLPAADQRLVCMIRARGNTWHRPFTTFELAALQGLAEPEAAFNLDGTSDAGWRERIGNAVPPPAAQAIAGAMGHTLLLAWSGETFLLSMAPVWVQPALTALTVPDQGIELNH